MMPADPPSISPPPSKRRRHSPPEALKEQDVIPSAIIPPPTSLPSAVPTSRSLRLYSWNINGIQSFLPPSTPQITNFFTSSSNVKPRPSQPDLHSNLQRWNWPHILFLQEVKIAPRDTKTPGLLRRIVNAPLDHEHQDLPTEQLYDSHLCLPRDKHNGTGFGGKIYGVCTLLRHDISLGTTIKEVAWDLEGRVQVIEMPSIGIIAINVYAVNGTRYDYQDPETGKVIGNRHDRKRAFHTLLAKEVKAYEDRGWNVIVAGDINISRSTIDSFPQLRMGEDHVKNRADFEDKFIMDLGMLDTFRLKHGERQKYSYRPTNKPWGAGGDRVDMILVTRGLGGYVEDADVLDTEMDRGPSDHVPVVLEIETRSRHQ